MRFFQSAQPRPGSKFNRLLIRGDSEGAIKIWDIPEVTNSQLSQIRQGEYNKAPGIVVIFSNHFTVRDYMCVCDWIVVTVVIAPTVATTMAAAWAEMKPLPAGILDQLVSYCLTFLTHPRTLYILTSDWFRLQDTVNMPSIRLTASIYLPQQGRLVCGREDGSIVIVPASQTVMLQVLHGKHQQYDGTYNLNGEFKYPTIDFIRQLIILRRHCQICSFNGARFSAIE